MYDSLSQPPPLTLYVGEITLVSGRQCKRKRYVFMDTFIFNKQRNTLLLHNNRHEMYYKSNHMYFADLSYAWDHLFECQYRV